MIIEPFNKVITGEDGFLMTHLLKKKVFNNFKDCIIHFGSPSSVEEFTLESTQNMINDVKTLLMLPHKKFIFASSMGVEFDSNNKAQQMYNNAKKKCEKLIINSGKQYCILRIPRVYGVGRKKGLLKDLKNNIVPNTDYDKVIEYLDIKEFVAQTSIIKQNNVIIHYKNLSVNTIRGIKKLYIKG